MLIRLARLFPVLAARVKLAVGQNLTAEGLQKEAEYLKGQGRESFERPYGLAWLLQLAAELHAWEDPDGRKWFRAMQPLVRVAVRRLEQWLRKLSHPVRSGEHSQTAFSLGLMLDYARACRQAGFEKLIEAKVREFYWKDRDCPLAYEPSGEDFLSPCLAEADVVRRVIGGREFAKWLERFLPGIPGDGSLWMQPAGVMDRRDPKLGHLDGLNLSRAWMMPGVAEALPPGDGRIASLRRTAEAHARAGLRSVGGGHYEGAHWLGTFAVYLLT